MAIVLVLAAHGARLAPEVNEPHYLCKAKHFWQPDWLVKDPFITSPDAHLVFYCLCGWWTKFMPLTAVAYLGRVVCWLALAAGWLHLWNGVKLSPRLAWMGALGWIALNERGQMAGEWVIGGFESKGLAYACVLFGLAQMVRANWFACWIWLGAASAWHPLVGGWTVLVTAVSWLANGWKRETWLSDVLRSAAGCLVGGILAAPGLIPVLLLNRGVDADTQALAARIYFRRLHHHLDLTAFRAPMVRSFAVLFVIWLLLNLLRMYQAKSLTGIRLANAAAHGRLQGAVCGSHLALLFGALLTIPVWDQPSQMAHLLRFYFYREADVLLPLGTVMAVGWLWKYVAEGVGRGARAGRWIVAAVCVTGAAWHAWQLPARWQLAYPLADKPDKVGDSVAWKQACLWVRDNTPADALFLTPRLGQSFKWWAERAEVSTWKDIPQNARGLVAWYQAQYGIYRNQDPCAEANWFQQPGDLDVNRLLLLQRRWPFDHLLTRRGERELPWPVLYENSHYRVYRVPETP